MAFRNAASLVNTASGASCAVPVSSIGIQLGDLLLFFAGTANSGKAFAYPSGFSAVPGLSNINCTLNGSAATFGVAYKVATSTEVAASTLSVSTTDSPGWMVGHVRAYSGRNTSSPFSAVASTADTAASGNPLAFSLTGLTAIAHDDIVCGIIISNNTQTNSTFDTPPAGFADGVVLDQSGFNPNLGFCDRVDAAAGATGTLTGDIATFGGTYGYGGYVISLAKSASGVVPGPGAMSGGMRNMSGGMRG
jgi:hypothetical protein